jgi:hypothetical protein
MLVTDVRSEVALARVAVSEGGLVACEHERVAAIGSTVSECHADAALVLRGLALDATAARRTLFHGNPTARIDGLPSALHGDAFASMAEIRPRVKSPLASGDDVSGSVLRIAGGDRVPAA